MGSLALAKRERLFLEAMETCSVQPKTVFYHAYRTCIMSCSPFAIFQALVDDPDFFDYEHVWVYGSDRALEYDTFKRYIGHPRVRFVKLGSIGHVEALATAGYLITNAGLPSYWQKRAGQIVINTWHGTPLKMLGADARDFDAGSIGNAQRNFLSSDYLVMPNRYTADKILDSYGIRGMFRGEVLDLGSPRIDLVVHSDRARTRALLERKTGSSLDGKRVVLYAPTFRSEGGKSVNTASEMAEYMSELVALLPCDCVAFFKVHNTLSELFIGDEVMESRLIFDEVETNELLAATDVLITDYSSICIDFLCTGRPIVLFAYDKERYARERGLYIPVEKMPGFECSTVAQVAECVRAVGEQPVDYPNRCCAMEEFAYHDDGNATERVIDVVFRRGCSDVKAEALPARTASEEKTEVLISLDNQPQLSALLMLLALLRDLDPGTHRVTIAAHDVHLLWHVCSRVFPQANIVFSDISTRLSKRNECFLRGQYRKFFGDVVFDRYCDLKRKRTFIDEVIESALPEVERQWHFSLPASIEAETAWERAAEYDEVFAYCRDCVELPSWLLDAGARVVTLADRRGNSEASTIAVLFSFAQSAVACMGALTSDLLACGYEVIVAADKPGDMSVNYPYVEAGVDIVPVSAVDEASACFIDFAVGPSVGAEVFDAVYEPLVRQGVLLVNANDESGRLVESLLARKGKPLSDRDRMRFWYRSMVESRLYDYRCENRRLGLAYDLEPLISLLEFDVDGVAQCEANQFIESMKRLLDEGFQLVKAEYFESTRGFGNAGNNPVLQAEYYDWLFEAGRYDELEHPKFERLLTPQSRERNLALVALERHQSGKAIDHLLASLRCELVDGEQAASSPDERLDATLARFMDCPLKAVLYRRLLDGDNDELIGLVFDEPDRDPFVACHLARQLNRQGRHRECIELCDRALIHYSAKGRRGPTAQQTAMLYVKKAVYRLIIRERAKAKSAAMHCEN